MADEGKLQDEEKVRFSNPSKESLAGVLLDSRSPETAVLCHGYSDHKNGFHLPAIARALAAKGWSSLRYRQQVAQLERASGGLWSFLDAA